MLTAKNVTSLPAPERGQKDYADEGLPGFSLRVSASGRRVYTLYYRVRGSGKKPRVPHENYPFLRLKKPFQHESRRKRFYNTEEIRSIWTAIEYEPEAPGAHPDGSRVAEGYFKMLWYTAARRGEVARMRFDAIDFDKHRWVLYDTKNDEPLVLPLPRQAMKIIDSLRPLAQEHSSPFVFFSVRPDARQGHLDPTSGAPASRIRARSGVADFRPHDIRRTVRTNLAEMGVGREVAEAILNHVQDKMSETYNRHRYQSQMGDALQRWADRLDQIVGCAKAEVVHMGARR